MQERLELIFNLFPPRSSGWSQYQGMFTLPAQSRQKCWSLSVLWSGRDFTLNALICTNRINIISVSHTVTQSHWHRLNSQAPVLLSLFPVSVHSFSSTGVHGVPPVTKPDKNRHKSRPFRSNSITEQRRPASSPIMSKVPHWRHFINVLQSHAISPDLCVRQDFYHWKSKTYRGLNWRLPSQIIYTNQNNATSNITVVSAYQH